MSIPDLRTPGERALLEVRASQVLLRLLSARQQGIEAIFANVALIQDKQPALTASLLVREALRMAPHRRLDLLKKAQQLVEEHGMAPDVDRQEIQAAVDFLQNLIQEAQEAVRRREKRIDLALKASFVLALLLTLSLLTFAIYNSLRSRPQDESSTTEKGAAETRLTGEATKPEGVKSK